jgi:magnesium transporter
MDVDVAPSSRAAGDAEDAGTVAIVAALDGKIHESDSIDAIAQFLGDERARVWIDLVEPSRSQVATVCKALGLHPLIAEDIGESNERAKVEHIGEVIHLVLFALSRDTLFRVDELDFVLGDRYLLSVHPSSWDPRAAHQLKIGLGSVIARGSDYLLWALVDAVVDGYFPIFDQLADEIDDLQDRVLEKPDRDALEQVFRLKRELIRVRHVLAPSREIFNQLTSREYTQIAEPQILYFRDIYDHLIRLTDDFDSYRELVSATVEVYLSMINNNLSAIMKRLTGVTVVLAGIGAVGGIFGMSQATPALAGQEGSGFWAITVGTIVVAAIAIPILRRIGWI